MDKLNPKSHAEQVALFRYGLIAALHRSDLHHGDLAAELRALSERVVRPPGSELTRRYSVPTLERWLYAYKAGGLAALVPRGRSDRGRGRDLDPKLRELLCDIRREHPRVSVPLMLRTLRNDGRVDETVTVCTVRRLLAAQGLPRLPRSDGDSPKTRLRWQAERPGALWHGDVCHGHTLTPEPNRRIPVRIHAMLDDASRYVVRLCVANNEREETMLSLFSQALMEHGRPDALYLDNGSTYRGDILRLACARLGISLLHARPYDAPARGKMERFWRRLREEALSHIGSVCTLADVEGKLHYWLQHHYHRDPHAGILGRTPATVFAEGEKTHVSEDDLRAALTVRTRRRVRRDSTVSVGGTVYEVPLGYLAGQVVTLATCLFDSPEPKLELDGRHLSLHPVDPVENARRRRPPRHPTPSRAKRPVDFDPGRTLAPKASAPKDNAP